MKSVLSPSEFSDSLAKLCYTIDMMKFISLRMAFAMALFGMLPCWSDEGAFWFGAQFSSYYLGEVLSNKDVVGGGWLQWTSSTSVTNVGAGAMRIDTTSTTEDPAVVFAAQAAAGEAVWSVDVRMKPELAMPFGVAVDGGCCSVTFVDGEGNEGVDFAGVVDGRWYRLFASGVAPVLNEWHELRMEIRRFDGAPFAGFSVKAGEAWLPLVSKEKMRWFPVREEVVRAAHEVAIGGRGEFSDFAARRGTSSAETSALVWIGGSAGDWSDGTKWAATAGGAALNRAPAPGELVKIGGVVELTLNGETAKVRDLMARVGADGTVEFLAGHVVPTVSLKTTRPSVTKPLEVKVASFNGATPDVRVTWQRYDLSHSRSALLGTSPTLTLAPVDYEHWIRCTVEDEDGSCLLEKEFYFSKLPVFYLTTNDGRTPSPSKEKHAGTLYVQGNAEWKSPYGDGIGEGGAMEINVRGNTTANQNKKPWKIKLDKKTELFGFPKSKHWVLLANYFDESNLRNKLAYDFANEIGSKGMKSTWVECFLNGEWQGLYLLCEQIRIDKNRVEIFDWEGAAEEAADAIAAAHAFNDADKASLEEAMTTNLGWIDSGKVSFKGVTFRVDQEWPDYATVVSDVTGGYLFEFDWSYDEVSRFHIYSGNLQLDTMLKSPEYLKTSPRLLDWCKAFLQNYADAITSPDGYSKEGLHYSQYADIDSMVSYFFVMEMFGNDDARYKSNNTYKDRGGALMKFGPVWDFDWGVGNYQVPYAPERWLVNHSLNSFFREWSDDPWFCTLLWTRYPAVRERFVEIIRTGGLIDQYYEYLREAGVANARKWTHHYGFSGGIYGTGSHPGLKAFLTTRLAWLDQQFRDVPTLMESLKGATSYVVDANHDGGNPLQTWPYVASATLLPISFANAPSNRLCDGQSLRMAFRLGVGGVGRLGVFVNGLRLGDATVQADGQVEVVIPFEKLTVPIGDPNCVSLIAYNSLGNVLARNYALVTVSDWTDQDATQPTLAEDGRRVPPIPHEWIRNAALAVMPSLAYATPDEFAVAAWSRPSPWGKSTALWEDYVAGTNPDPAGPDSTFRITSIVVTNGVPALTWSPDLGAARRYTVEGKVRLDDKNEPWQAPLPPGARFFKVKVSLP